MHRAMEGRRLKRIFSRERSNVVSTSIKLFVEESHSNDKTNNEHFLLSRSRPNLGRSNGSGDASASYPTIYFN